MTVSFLTQLPNGRIEVAAAWGANPAGDPSTWSYTDITSDVRFDVGIEFDHGKADESSDAQPSSVIFALNNTTGAYTPYLATGANYPNVRRNTPIRVRQSLDSGVTWFTRFLGFADGFVPSWDTSGTLAIVNVSASGRMRRYGRDAPLKSPLYRAIMNKDPLGYWSLEDPRDSTQGSASVTDTDPVTITGTVPLDWADTTGVIPGGGPVVKLGRLNMDDDTAKTAIFTNAHGTNSTEWTIGGWFVASMRDDNTTGNCFFYLMLWDGKPFPSNTQWSVFATAGPDWLGFGDINLSFDSGNQGIKPTVASKPFNGQPHYIAVTARQTVPGEITMTLYYDGVAYTGPSFGGNPATGFTQRPIGLIEIGGGATNLDLTQDPILNVGHIHAFDRALSDADVLEIYNAGIGYVGESATDRIARLCTEESIALELSGYEDFEDTTLALTISGTWARSNTQAHAGTWSFKSASIGHGATTDAVVTVPAGATSMTVWYKVSSEEDFDFFRILRDGVQEFEASGEVDWTQRTVDVRGVSLVTFRYIKDPAVVAGSDAAWIDGLSFVISPVQMGAQSTDTFLDLLRECESADHGVLYDGFGPGLAYRSRDSVYNATASLTIDVSTGQLAPPFQPVDDDQRIRNKYTVSREGGSSATFEQSTGLLGTDSIGIYEGSTILNLSADSANYLHAGWLTHLGTVEGFRYPTLNLNFLSNPSLASSWLNTRLFDRIDVINVSSELPQHPPEPVSLILEGYTEKLSTTEWTVTANCAPYRPNVVGALNSTTPRLDCGATTLSATLPAETSFTAGFESGVTGWTPTSATFVQSATQAHSGTFSGLLSVVGAPSQAFVRPGIFPVTPGQRYSGTCWVYSPAGWSAVACVIDWYNASQVQISNTSSAATALAAGTWAQRTVTANAPVNAFYARLGPTLTGTPTGVTVYVDDVAFRTAVDVAISDTCVWTVVDGSYPITINGEDMTLSDVVAASGAGSSWTQQLFVLRAQNSVVRAHSSGAEVHVKNPFVLAL